MSWCGGSPQLRAESSVQWHVQAGVNRFDYKLCTVQRHFMSRVTHLGVQLEESEDILALCKPGSPVSCFTGTLVPRPGTDLNLYCREGKVLWDVPVHPDGDESRDVTVKVVDALGNEYARFCGKY